MQVRKRSRSAAAFLFYVSYLQLRSSARWSSRSKIAKPSHTFTFNVHTWWEHCAFKICACMCAKHRNVVNYFLVYEHMEYTYTYLNPMQREAKRDESISPVMAGAAASFFRFCVFFALASKRLFKRTISSCFVSPFILATVAQDLLTSSLLQVSSDLRSLLSPIFKGILFLMLKNWKT